MLNVSINENEAGRVNVKHSQETYKEGMEVVLTAVSFIGWEFSHWTGDVQGTDREIIVIMDDNKEIEAVFMREEFTLEAGVLGNGRIIIEPEQKKYFFGDLVLLIAEPNEGWSFSHWTGAVEDGLNEISIKIDGNKKIEAVFEEKIEFTVDFVIIGQGMIKIQPEKDKYNPGEIVSLTAKAGEGWGFSHWAGDAEGEEKEIVVKIDGNKRFGAAFLRRDSYKIDLVIQGQGSVIVEPEKENYYSGDLVSLTAIPRENWSFSNWGGDINSDKEVIEIKVISPKEIIVYFEREKYSDQDFFSIVTKGSAKEIKDYIDVGVNINARDFRGYTPLMFAAENNPCPDVIKILVENGGDVHLRDLSGQSAFMLAASNNTLEVVEVFLGMGVDFDVKDSTDSTPLFYAIKNNNDKRVAIKLLEKGVEVNNENSEGKTPLMYAVKNFRNTEIIKKLLENGARVDDSVGLTGKTPLMLAARYNTNPEIIKVLLDGGAAVNRRTYRARGDTALMFAARYNPNPEVIKALLEGGAYINKRTDGLLLGPTALHFSASYNLVPKVTEALLDAGADPLIWYFGTPYEYAKNNPGLRTSPVMVKFPEGFIELVKDTDAETLIEALEYGADPNARNRMGFTVLMSAAKSNENPEIINILLEHGADGSAKCRAEKTAFDYSKENDAIKGTEVYWKLNDLQFE